MTQAWRGETIAADGRELTVRGLDSPDGNPLEPEPEFLAFADGATFRPEAMAVHSCLTVTASGSWSYHTDKPAGSHSPVAGSDWVQSASLSFTGTSPHDVRPYLLALMRWEVGAAITPCLRYGQAYLRVWCDRKGQRPRPAVIAAATLDALALAFWGRRRQGMPTIEERRVELRVDKGRYADYRALMVTVFEQRLSEAAGRYKAISHYRAIKTTDYRANGLAGSSLWIKAHAMAGPVLTLIPAIQHPQSDIMKDRQDFTAMTAPASRSRAA
ncbi:hypothetical protein [Rhodanobacter sp. OR87]|uniref:hypothetical protein n=1 Tax=Rhodanobacter sp. OR87 TaxID=1076523 RepID=UPI0004887500|nr:hypothetical protein [Rhodanobacter sp. OR87]